MSIVLVGSTSGSVTLQEPAVAGTTVLDLPATSGTILTTASSGQSIPKAALPTGSILQVASAYKTDTQTISSGIPTFVDVTSLSVTLTPTSSSSKFLCIWSLNLANGTDAGTCHVRLNRNGTAIGLADAASNRTTGSSAYINTAIGGQMIPSSNSYLDSPATSSAVTYKLTVTSNNTSYVNRSSRDNDASNFDGRVTSSITILEISA